MTKATRTNRRVRTGGVRWLSDMHYGAATFYENGVGYYLCMLYEL
jgi:hypothetical protein